MSGADQIHSDDTPIFSEDMLKEAYSDAEWCCIDGHEFTEAPTVLVLTLCSDHGKDADKLEIHLKG